jgi:hypothetical protein
MIQKKEILYYWHFSPLGRPKKIRIDGNSVTHDFLVCSDGAELGLSGSELREDEVCEDYILMVGKTIWP